MQANDTNSKQALIERFKAFYKDVKHPKLDAIGDVYASNIKFRDPIHQVQGLAELHAYLSETCESVESGRFEFLDQLVGQDKAYIKWNMYFCHPKLGKETHVVRGMSQIQFDDRIYYHEDVYDMGQMIYEHVPVVGWAVKRLRQRLATEG
ncbi:SnoaL-like domain protein [Marinomonas gallaica]|uniref:SnoaL-like domain protein n=1 Tax=Marinomonas gallaica TaxID=1806667 RepID=A0A1C3JLL3_9GAMM|nr:nuclear transport factor 2 family protein [Marinomonas gallaica]MCO4784338.1 nuclear transport factor 2 family protein [Marinomonas atlantica]SBT16051.1 SnoaL-like domain protein [Marinomonas gallaica]SBT21099.1 SnoaL-like domain protein [Marinomonas gallaica]